MSDVLCTAIFDELLRQMAARIKNMHKITTEYTHNTGLLKYKKKPKSTRNPLDFSRRLFDYCQGGVEGLELELELDASADPSHPTDDNEEESYSLYISPFVPKLAI